jgi:hypothetical protein
MRAVLLTLGLVLATPALGQGNDAATTASGGNQQGAAERQVQVGAGAVSGDSTTGASGPSQGGGSPQPQPLPATFDLRPPVSAFWGPRQLPIRNEVTLRCEIISDGNARRHCETRGQAGSKAKQ